MAHVTLTYANLEQHASKLLNQHETLQNKLLLVRSLRIHIEIVQTTKYQSFLNTFFPVFEKFLTHTMTPQTEDNEEQKLRYEVLEILSKLPTNKVMVAYAARLCKLVVFCLSQENEKNGLVCLRILHNLHQHLRLHIQHETQAFVIFIHEVYHDFEHNATKAIEGTQHDEFEGTSASKSSTLLPGCLSFKVITESVLFFMRLLSSPDSEGQRDMVSKIIPLIVKAVGFQYPDSSSHLHINRPSSNLQQILTELKVGQAKALMTLMELMKVHPEVVRPHARDIANNIVKSLETCPSHVTEIRRDLFEVICKFLALDWRTTFPDFVYKLYDERVLLGSKQKGSGSLHLLVAEVLYTLFNYASTCLDTPFVSQQIVNTSTRFINEYSLPFTCQSKLLRVILSMAVTLHAKRNLGFPKEEANTIMVQIMETFMIHFRAVKGYLPKVLHVDAKDAKEDVEKKSIEQLVYILFIGLCTLVTMNFVNVTQSSTSGEPNNDVSALKILTRDETHMVAKILRRAISYATLFEEQNLEKMLLRATKAFRCVEHSSMMAIFSLCIDSAFKNSLTCRHKTYFHSFFLNSEVTRRPYMKVLLNYLVETKLDTLKHVSPTSNLVVSLFNLIYKAMAMASSESSADIMTHIDKVKCIIQACLDLAVEVANPRPCINLIMETFGALQTPPFHKLWPHLTHLLTPCLDTFLHLLNNDNNNPTTRDALIQLCIIFPAEPGTLLEHLPRLAGGPLLLALGASSASAKATNEPLLKIGLEYLDGWIDHLGLPALAACIGPRTVAELGATLVAHFTPLPNNNNNNNTFVVEEPRLHEGGGEGGGDPPGPMYPWGERILTVLGKLGSEGRSFLSHEPLEVEVTEDLKEARVMLVDCAFGLDAPVHVPLDGSIECLVQKLNVFGPMCSSSTIAYRRQAFKFLELSLAAALNLTGEMHMAHKNLSASLMSSVPKKYRTSTFINESDDTSGTTIMKPEARRTAEHRVLKELLMAFIATSLDKELQTDTPETFVVGVTRHFAILHGARAMEIVMKSLKPSGDNSSHIDEATRDLNLKVFMDAVVTVLALPNPLHAKGGLYVLKVFLEMFWEVLQSLQNVHKTFDHVEKNDSNTTTTPTLEFTNHDHHAESRDRLVHASYIVFDEVYANLYKNCGHGSDRLSQLGGFRGFDIFFRSIPPYALWKYQESVIQSLVCFIKWWPAQNRFEEEELDGLLAHLLSRVYTIIFHAGHAFPDLMLQSAQKIAAFMLAALLESSTKTNSWKKPLGKPVQEALVDLIAIIQTRVAAVGILNAWSEVVGRSLASSNGNELEMQTKLRLLLKIRVPYLLEIIHKDWLHQHLQRALAIAQFEPISNEELQLQHNEQKVVCIDLLCAALSRNDIKNHLPFKMKSEIMKMYLNNLTSNVPAYAQVAKSNLHQVIEPENYSLVTREMLKPLLMRLRSFKSLDLPLLQGLGLLSNNILTVSRSVANELMEHLKSFLEPNNLLEFQSSWEGGMDSNIASGIMQLCTLFNSPLESYLGEVVEVAMKLEAALPAGLHHMKFPRSPYHVPLARVLNQNPRITVQYFLPRLNQPAVYHLFKNIMRMDLGKPIRTEFLMQTQTLSLEKVISFQYEFVALVALVMKLDHSEAVQNGFIMKLLIQLWSSHAQKIHLVVGEQGSTLRQAVQCKRLKHCLFKFLRHRKGQWSVFWDMIPLFLVENHPQQQDVQFFFENEVLQGSSPTEKKSFLDYTFLKHFKDYPVSNEHMFLVVALRRVITPMLVHAWKHNYINEVLSPPVLLELRAFLLEPRTEVMEVYTEELTFQVLQLATLLLAHTSIATCSILLGSGNGIRRPIPSLCKREIERMDSRPSRIWALLAAAESLELSPQMLQLDPDILKEAYNVLRQLLKGILNGTKESSLRVMHAIKVLLPKLPQGHPSDEQPPYWVLLFRFFLISTENSDKLVRFLEIIKSQPDIFYAFRGQFVQQLVRISIRFGNMNVKSSPPLRSATVDFQTLAVEVVGLVVAWEARSQQQPETNKFHFNKPAEEFSTEIANFLLKMAVLHKENTRMALYFLLKAVEVWPNMNVQFKLLRSETNCLPQQLWVMIQVIEKQPLRFIRSNILALNEVVELSFSQRSEGITLMLCMLVKLLFTPISDAGTSIMAPELTDLQHKVNKLLSSNLQAVLHSLQAPMEMKNAIHIATHALQVLETLAEIRVDLIDSYVKQLWSLFGDVTNGVHGVVDSNKKNEQESDMTTLAPLHLKLLRVLGHYVPRRPGLVDGSLMYFKNLAEKTEHAVGLLGILDLLRDWWIDASDQDMWVQDSGVQRIVNCMEILGHVDHLKMEPKHRMKWEVEFLNLLFCLCSDDHSRYPQSFRTAIFLKLKKMCLRGLVVEDPEVRQKFRTLFSSVGSSTFSMLTFIIEFEGWEKLCGSFWLQQGLDLILGFAQDASARNASIDIQMETQTAEESIVPLPDSPFPAELEESLEGFVYENDTFRAENFDEDPAFSLGDLGIQLSKLAVQVPDETPQVTSDITDKHAMFLIGMSHIKVTEALTSLREILKLDTEVAHQLWVTLFPLLWSNLQVEEMERLKDSIVTLLAKDWHYEQRHQRPNVVKTLLESISLCQPLPRLPGLLVSFLGKKYGASQIACSILGSSLPNDPEDQQNLAKLYSHVDAEDLRVGLWKQISTCSVTLNGLSLLQHGYYETALDFFLHAMKSSCEKRSGLEDLPIWSEKVVDCARQLNQWEVLAAMGHNNENFFLLQDTSWIIRDFPKLKNLVNKEQMEDSDKKYIVLAYMAMMQDPETKSAEQYIKEARIHALQNWWGTPETSIHTRGSILHDSQRLLEISEIKGVYTQTKQLSLQEVPPAPETSKVLQVVNSLRDVLLKWKHRIPRKWDSMAVWDELMQWRHCVCADIVRMCNLENSSPALKQLSDLASQHLVWTSHKLASVARKQGLYQLSRQTLDNLQNKSQLSRQLNEEESYINLMEKAKTDLHMKGRLVNGYNLLMKTDISPFSNSQKARFFQLQGEYITNLGQQQQHQEGDTNKLMDVLLSSIHLEEGFAKSWISWGNFCNQVYKDTGDQNMLECTLMCSFKGIELKSKHKHDCLPRVLSLLTFHNQEGTVTKVFENCSELIPPSSWIPWIPHLLLALQTSTLPNNTCAKILKEIAVFSPQSLYYWIYSVPSGLRQDAGTSTAYEAHSPRINNLHINVIRNILMGKSQSLLRELQDFRVHVGYLFPINTDEKLHEHLHSLLRYCYKGELKLSEKVPYNLPHLKTLYNNIFKTAMVTQYADYARTYERDFYNPASTMADLISRTRHWLRDLQIKLHNRPQVSMLEANEHFRRRSFKEIQIPGQYLKNPEIHPDQTVLLDRISTQIQTVTRNGRFLRRITLIGHDGSHHHFLRQLDSIKSSHSSDRVVHLLRTLNRFLDNHKESRRRQLRIHTPVTVPLGMFENDAHVYLMEDRQTDTLLEDVYKTECEKLDQDPELPLDLTLKCLDVPSSELGDCGTRLENYNNIVEKVVRDTLFSQHMCKILTTDGMWTFKKQFTAHLALSGFTSYMLKAKFPAPSSLVFAKKSGQIFLSDFHPDYDSSGAVEFKDPVSFRLTPNLQNFITRAGVDGPFLTSMRAAAQAVAHKDEHFLNHLLVFYEDELLSSRISASLQERVTENAAQTLTRILQISPQADLKEDFDPQEMHLPLHQEVTTLLEAATKPENLCMMDPTWHPWF